MLLDKPEGIPHIVFFLFEKKNSVRNDNCKRLIIIFRKLSSLIIVISALRIKLLSIHAQRKET